MAAWQVIVVGVVVANVAIIMFGIGWEASRVKHVQRVPIGATVIMSGLLYEVRGWDARDDMYWLVGLNGGRTQVVSAGAFEEYER